MNPLLEEFRHHYLHDPHQTSTEISDIILGGQDGLVNVLGVILGIAAATGDPWVIIVAGLAATFAESVSMAAVAYTSTVASANVYDSERQREYRHILQAPTLEREEVVEIYQRKGFSGELLDRIVETITANTDVWVAVMMAEEHGLAPINRKHALRSAFVVGISAIIGSLIPMVPFFFLSIPVNVSMMLAVLVAALTLFIVGAYKARLTIGSPGKSGLEMAAIGTVSALVGYAVGVLLKLPSSP
jgi:VIT1/CCC1 family predicted Fe2+/Mn2+ transporter